MSEAAQLEKALAKLRGEGKAIGTPSMYDGQEVIPLDGVLMTHAQIFQATEISPTA